MSSSSLSFLLHGFPLSQNFEVKADDLEPIVELGRGAYGVVEKMRHVPSGQIMAVKVELTFPKPFLSVVFTFVHPPLQISPLPRSKTIFKGIKQKRLFAGSRLPSKCVENMSLTSPDTRAKLKLP